MKRKLKSLVRKASGYNIDRSMAYQMLRLIEAQRATINDLEASPHKTMLQRDLARCEATMRELWAN